MPIDLNTGPLITLIVALIAFLLLIILVEFFINRILQKENEEMYRTMESIIETSDSKRQESFMAGEKHAMKKIKGYTSEEFHHFFNK